MAKNIEIGIILPTDFIVENPTVYNIYNNGSSQIIRRETDILHGKTTLLLPNLTVTPLTKNTYKIKTFIKGENIGVIYRDLTIKVV